MVNSRILGQKQAARIALSKIGFDHFLVQAAILAHSRPPKDLRHLPPVKSMEALIESFKTTLTNNGGNTILFDNPDATAVGDNEVLQDLNRQLRINPEMEVPREYRKIEEPVVVYNHVLSEVLPIDEDYRISYELFADVVYDILDIHLIEPMSEIYQIVKAVPKKREEPKHSTYFKDAENYRRRIEKNAK